MTRIDRYILARLLRVFGFFALVLIAVYWVNRAVSLFDQLIGDGQSLLVFLEFTALSLPMMVRVVLPIAAFVSALYVTYQLLAQNEIAVLQAAGLSPLRLARPYLAFGLIVAAFLTLLMHVLIPQARAQLNLRQSELAQNVTATLLRDGVFQHPADGITLFISEITPDGALRGLYLSDSRALSQRIDYTARSALIVPERTGPKLVMIDGQAQIHDLATGRLSVTGFADFTYDLGGLIGSGGRWRSVQELPTAELLAPTPALLQETRATLAQIRYELAVRMVYGLGAVAAVLIAVASMLAGGFSRLGFARPMLGAVVLLILSELAVNAVARVALRDADLAPLAALPVTLASLTALGLLVWAGRRRRVPRTGGAT
jgi:lipopolysaccharide export system permease protein